MCLEKNVQKFTPLPPFPFPLTPFYQGQLFQQEVCFP